MTVDSKVTLGTSGDNDASTTDCGIIVTTGPQCYLRVHRHCTLPAGQWYLSFQDKAVRTALKLVQEDMLNDMLGMH